jgi:hypothetical protein
MHSSIKYTLKVWSTSVIVSAAFIVLCFISHNNNDLVGTISFWFYIIVFGGMLSIPSATLLWITTYVLLKTNFNNIVQKSILTFVGILLTALPFFFIVGDFRLASDLDLTIILFAVPVVAGIWIYRLQPAIDKELPGNIVGFSEPEQDHSLNGLNDMT